MTTKDLNAITSTTVIEAATAPANPRVGQRWLDTGDRLVWYWNGTYWLSESILTATCPIISIVGDAQPGILSTVSPHPYNLYLLSFEFTFFVNAPQNATDYWTVSLQRSTGAGFTSLASNTFNGFAIASSFTTGTFRSTLNLHQDLAALTPIIYRIGLTRSGSAGAVFSSAGSLRYRLAKL